MGYEFFNIDNFRGRVYGKLTVIDSAEYTYSVNGDRITNALCRCECGIIKVIRVHSLQKGSTRSCGCIGKVYVKDYIGKKYGKLTILSEGNGKSRLDNKNIRPTVICQCDCGNTCEIILSRVINNYTVSCGCFNYEARKDIIVTHGMSEKAEYNIWNSILQRCLNPNNKAWDHYGGRGITVHPDWINDFQAFYNYMGPRPSSKFSIDRIDNDGHYEPGNVRWATREQQALNKSNTIIVGYKGRSQSLMEWSRELNIPYRHLYYKLDKGFKFDEILQEYSSRSMADSHSSRTGGQTMWR